MDPSPAVPLCRCGAPASPRFRTPTCEACAARRAQAERDRRAHRRESPAAHLAARLGSAARDIRKRWPAAPAALVPDLVAVAGRLDQFARALAAR